MLMRLQELCESGISMVHVILFYFILLQMGEPYFSNNSASVSLVMIRIGLGLLLDQLGRDFYQLIKQSSHKSQTTRGSGTHHSRSRRTFNVSLCCTASADE